MSARPCDACQLSFAFPDGRTSSGASNTSHELVQPGKEHRNKRVHGRLEQQQTRNPSHHMLFGFPQFNAENHIGVTRVGCLAVQILEYGLRLLVKDMEASAVHTRRQHTLTRKIATLIRRRFADKGRLMACLGRSPVVDEGTRKVRPCRHCFWSQPDAAGWRRKPLPDGNATTDRTWPIQPDADEVFHIERQAHELRPSGMKMVRDWLASAML